MANLTKVVGRTLKNVTVSLDKEVVTFEFLDDSSVSYGVKGDCCSVSWIEHLEMPDDINGATILSVTESAPVTEDHDEHDKDYQDECVEVYNTAFRTSRGDIILEYRNSSNGYYGGYLVDVS